MSTLDETSVVCRTCLKVLDKTGFTYLDDEGGYVKNVGNIREMLQFCLPELDLYVSSHPVMCYQCLPILVQIYNFKIKCLSGENIIKAYITRNNLQEYNHVNLNCVLMDDLKLKSQKIQIESRIKHMMLKELPETGEMADPQPADSVNVMENVNQSSSEVMENQENCFNIVITQPEIVEDSQESHEEIIEREMKIEIEETDEPDLDYSNQNQDDMEADGADAIEEDSDMNTSSSIDEESNTDTQTNMVVVRKDLFENDNQNSVEAPPKEQPTVIINNGGLPRNGRIIIKIDRQKLQNLNINAPESESTTVKDNPPEIALSALLTPAQVSVKPSVSSNDPCTPQIVSVETVEGTSVKSTYNCNKCIYVTDDVIKMYDHNRTHHSFDYTCQHCPFSTSKVELLGKHMTMVHPQNMISHRQHQHFKVTENYACSMCPFSVKSIDLLRSHHLSAHGKTDREQGPIVLNNAFADDIPRNELRILKRLEYTCDVCPYTTKDKSNLRKHLFTHGTKPLKCDHCTYKCVSPYQLRRHQKQKHAKHLDPVRPRSQPYKLPDFKKEKSDALDNFKITLETIKRELEKEIST